MSAHRRTYSSDDLGALVAELLLAGDKSLGTRSPLDRLAEWMERCDSCGAALEHPCLPRDGEDRQERARRNHYAHKSRREATAERLSRMLAAAIASQEA